MQIIKTILKLSGDAVVSDEYGGSSDAPEVKIGIAAALELDLRNNSVDENSGKLLPYSYNELSGADSFYLCLDGDWDHATQPKLFKVSGISLYQDDNGNTIFRAELPETATPTLLAAVAKNKSLTLTAEFCGYKAVDGVAKAVFAWDFSLVLKNRVFVGDEVPEEVSSNPEYLTAVQVMALINDATRSETPGPDGASAYEVAVANGYEGTEAEWLASLEGAGGEDGATAYALAVANGYEGTIAEWLADLEGKNAYELAVEGGYEGTKSEWLESLKGADGQGLEFDATGTLTEKALYDDKPAGFKFAATVVDSVAKKTTLYIYAKNSNDIGDWCENPVVIVFYAASAATITSIAPVEFEAPADSDNNYLFFSLSDYPNAHITHVVIDTADGELVLPYYSDQGVRKILRKNNIMYIYFGANVPEYSTGRVYLSQMVGTNAVGEAITTGTMYYGYVQDETMTSVAEITADMLTQATMTSATAGMLEKQSIGVVPAGAWVAVLVPVGYVATKFDGVSDQIAFAENNGAAGTGANGTEIELDGETYKLYGEFQLTSSEKFIYVDAE